ncbi:hypothetical protein [Snodgrassella sp. CFCC 13594]|nr:hypothetical protein [Snodgrassella sp. CFCC 13594]
MEDITVKLGLDANAFISGMRTAEEQNAKGMASLQKSYQAAAKGRRV